jgi:hypothetical protein
LFNKFSESFLYFAIANGSNRKEHRLFAGYNAIYGESLPAEAAPYARRTMRLQAEQRQLALEHGDEAAARMAHR